MVDVLLSRAMDIKWEGSLGRAPFYTQSKISRTRLGLLAGLLIAGLLMGGLLIAGLLMAGLLFMAGLLIGALLMALLIGALLIGLLIGGAFLPLLGLGPPRANRG